jgi:hypothetical protein
MGYGNLQQPKQQQQIGQARNEWEAKERKIS